ncbi:hypothetical protein [Candidatus Electrothrix sp.]|uniref:hypothetical protein n=1 Tax=Candidatus Electrothrix sp. TaxID=2170559 RepID=UPI0040579FCD
MDVKAAVKLAKEYILYLFDEEEINNLGLEEVEFYEGEEAWSVTVGFSRPWEVPNDTILASLAKPPGRSYKIVRIDDKAGQVKSVKNRAVPS